jgi:hypothetical protein
MLVMNLLIPITMISFGHSFEKKPPKIERSKFAFGYRTIMSMKNADTWEYAHRIFGKLWFRFGIVLGLISIIPLFFVIGKDKDTVGFAGLIICFVQLVAMLLPVIPTELALRRRFDKYGNRKDK